MTNVKPKTLLLFPGIDALEDPRYRKPAREIPGYERRVTEIGAHLEKIGGAPLDLERFYENTFAPTEMPIRELGMATLAAQTSLFDAYVAENGKPDALLGCSLGDIARTVCAGSVDLPYAIESMNEFGSRIQKIRGGLVASVRTDKPYDDSTISELENSGLEICVYQTERHLLVAGPMDRVVELAKVAKTRDGMKVKILYPFPLHSSLVVPAAEPLRPRIAAVPLRKPEIQIFSSIYVRPIADEEELREETYLNMIRTVRFRQAIEAAAKAGFTRFVNIGPAPTLLQFIERIPLPAGIECIDYFGAKA